MMIPDLEELAALELKAAATFVLETDALGSADGDDLLLGWFRTPGPVTMVLLLALTLVRALIVLILVIHVFVVRLFTIVVIRLISLSLLLVEVASKGQDARTTRRGPAPEQVAG